MKKLIIPACILAFGLAACSKDDPAPAADKYMTISTNSRWIYDVTTDPGTAGASTFQDTVTVSPTDTSINGRSYRIFTHSGGGSDYYHISGSDYYRFQQASGGGLDLSIEELYLKDNAAVGANWSQTVNVPVTGVGTLPVTLTNSILEKGGSKVVNGVTYNNVIAVKTDITVTGLPPGTITSNIRSYYAPVVGLIQGDYQVSIPLAGVDVNTQTLLKTADIR